jgi:hypothetical protein
VPICFVRAIDALDLGGYLYRHGLLTTSSGMPDLLRFRSLAASLSRSRMGHLLVGFSIPRQKFSFASVVGASLVRLSAGRWWGGAPVVLAHGAASAMCRATASTAGRRVARLLRSQ